jgi:hypothetical protein
VSEREQGFCEGVEAAAKIAGSWSISRGQVEDLADEIRKLSPPRPAGEPAPSPAPVARLRELIADTTPGPWAVEENSNPAQAWDVVDPNGATVAEWCTQGEAALIVAAVNNLEKLLDVCEAAQRLDERRIIGQPVSGAEADLHEALARVQP